MTRSADSLLLAVDESKVTPGVLGFVVVALLGVATWLLIRSMNRQLRKIDFEETDRPRAGTADGDIAPGNTANESNGEADRGSDPRDDGSDRSDGR